MGVSALLNFLPKVGLVARVAYLKKQHDVGYRVHVLSLVLVGVGTAAVYGVIVPAIFWRADFDAIWFALTIAGMAVFAAASVPVVRLVGRQGLRPVSTRSLLIGAGAWYLLRVADSFCFAGRLYFAAEIFGNPMPLSTALAVGVLCNFIVMFAPLPGGLGLREWVGGLLLNTSLTQGIGVKTGMSLLLVDRGAEVAVFVVAGLVGFGMLAWWRDQAAAET